MLQRTSVTERRMNTAAGKLCTFVLALTALALTPVAATAAPTKTEALPKVITLGVLESLTGAAGIYGQQELQGMALAVKEAKREKFLGKTQIALNVVDDASS